MPSSARRVAIAILALGLPVLLAVLGWSGMLLFGGLARDVSFLGATALLLLVFAPGLMIYARFAQAVFRDPMKRPAAPWNACIVLNAVWGAIAITNRAPFLGLYPLLFITLALLGRALEARTNGDSER